VRSEKHLLRCRSSTMYTDIACVAAPRICPPGARAKVDLLFCDRPLYLNRTVIMQMNVRLEKWLSVLLPV